MSNITQLKATATSERQAIDQRTAGSLQPRRHAYFVRDAIHKGFALKVNPAGTVVWITEGYVHGGRKSCRVTHGSATAISHEKALKLHFAVMEQLALGVDVSEQRRLSRSQALSWADLLEQYITDKTAAGKLRESTVRLYRSLMANPLASLSGYSIPDSSRSRVKKWYMKLNEHKTQANQCLRLLRSLHTYAHSLGMIPEHLIDPTKAITKTGLKYDDVVRGQQLRPEQLGEFAATVLKLSDMEDVITPTVRDAILMLLATGLRKESVLGIRWEDVDLDKRELSLPQTKTFEQVIPLTDFTYALLRSRQLGAKGPWVFPSARTNKKHLANPIYALAAVSKRMKLDWYVTPNKLRKSWSSLLGMLDTQQHHVKALMGHSLKGDVTLKHYQQMHMVPLRAAAQRAHDFISENMTLDGLVFVDHEIMANTLSLRLLAFGVGEGEELDGGDTFTLVPDEYGQL
jgi:integrase